MLYKYYMNQRYTPSLLVFYLPTTKFVNWTAPLLVPTINHSAQCNPKNQQIKEIYFYLRKLVTCSP